MYVPPIVYTPSYPREQNETRTTTVTPDRETCEHDREGGEDDEDHKQGKGEGWLHDEREVRCILLRFLRFFELATRVNIAGGGWMGMLLS
jgi:hypothetical protein